jgi:hypothetical protein
MSASIPPPPRTLRADDPSELLAEAHVCLGDVPRDCLVLIGHTRRRSSPLATRIALRDLSSSGGGVDLLGHLETMRRAGCDGAFALAIAGDGLRPVEPERADQVRMTALEVVRAAVLSGPGVFDVPEAWALAGGRAERFVLEPDGDGQLLLGIQEHPEALRPPRDTLVGVEEVRAGRRMPHDDPGADAALRRLGDHLRTVTAVAAHGPSVSPDSPRPAADLCEQVGALSRRLHRVRSLLVRSEPSETAAPDEGGQLMTECEQLAALRRSLAAPGSRTVLLETVTGLRAPTPDGSFDALVARLRTDPSLRPGRDICAGGEAYRTLEEMRLLLEGTGESPLDGESARAWAAISTALAVLAWWNHRFATAGDLAEEILMRCERDPLAPFLLQLADAPVRPAWQPTAV